MATSKALISRGIFSIGHNLTVVVLRFLSFYFIVRSLSQVNFGTWVLFLLITSILEVVRNGLIRNGLIRFLAISDDNEGKNIQTSSIILNFLITFLGLSMVLLTSTVLGEIWEAPELADMLKIYGFSAFLLVPLSHIEFVATANSRFDRIMIFNFVRHGSFLALVLILLNTHWGVSLNTLVISQVIAVLLGLTVGTMILRNYLSFSTTISRSWIRELFKFGRFVVGTNLGTIIFKSTDQMMLGALLGTQPVAVYNTALRVNNLLDTPIMGVSNIFYPHSSKKGQKGFKTVYERSVSIILSILLPSLVFIFLFSNWVIFVIAGSDYLESAAILRVTMLYSIFIPFARQFGTLLDSIGLPQINLRLTLLTSFINIFFSYLGIIYFGTIGAAYGTLVTYLTSFIIIQTYLSRKYSVNVYSIVLMSFKNYLMAFQAAKRWLRDFKK